MLDAVPGIDRIRIRGFGCIEDVEIELGPLQAFIGPNDSGKSTILRWVLALCGRAGTEGLRDGKVDELLSTHGCAPKDTAAMVAFVQQHGLASVPRDAASLSAWLARVEACLPATRG